LTPGRAQLDLLDQQAVADFFAAEAPDYVFMAAARVGGIYANSTYPAEFIHENLVIQSNVIEQAYRHHVKRLLFLGSSCIYPKEAPQPMSEDVLLTGLLEPTNEPYAIAKIAGIKTCESYNRQYGTQFIAVMPTNLYGPGDNFHPENSHVLPALIRRFHEAKKTSKAEVVVWGTGTPMRELLYVDDMADGSVFVMELDNAAIAQKLLNYPEPCFVNLGTGIDVTIRELAETVREVVGFKGELIFDPTKPDGTMRKLLDVSRMKALGWEAKVSLRDGIDKTYEWFLKHQACFRA
jgi:GDP-L-fucose synthase